MDEVYGGTWPGSLVGRWRRVAGFLSGSMDASPNRNYEKQIH